MNLAARGGGLELSETTGSAIEQWNRLEAEGAWVVRTAVVMPDHLHLLVQLGECSALMECVRLFKGRLSRVLRVHGLRWQDGFYDHRIRASEDMLPVFLYIYLNPHRAGLLTGHEVWPGYFCTAEDWKWFGPLTRESSPQPEWLR